jgi:hypothetical protein
MKTVTDGNGTTHFFDMSHDGTTSGAMLFIPLQVSLVEQVPMVVYYHGHNSQHSIEGYIKALSDRDFRPSLRDKQVILVEPWGGPRSKFHYYQTPHGLQELIDQAMFVAVSNGPPARPCPVRPPPPDSLILAGFSGGGQALDGVVWTKGGHYHRLLTEVWCFDCMYSGEGGTWANWSRHHDSVKLRVRLSTQESSGSPRNQAKTLGSESKGLNVDIGGVVQSTHEGLPGKFISTWL